MLRQILVHRQRAGQVSTPGIRHARQVEQRLDRPVLTVPAMQREEDDVGLAALGKHTHCLRQCLARHAIELLTRWRQCPNGTLPQLAFGSLAEWPTRSIDSRN